MVRYGSNSGVLDNLSYNYETGSNKLASIGNTAAGETYSYTYDSNGNLLTDSYREVSNLICNSINLSIQATLGGSTNVYYWYDSNGNRIRKQYDVGDEVYIIGADGQTEAVFEANGTAKFFNITGGGETIGRYEPMADELVLSDETLSGPYTANTISTENTVTVSGDAELKAGRSITLNTGFSVPDGSTFEAYITEDVLEPSRFYYLKDHLGSIRLTINESGIIQSYDDYYAWGMQLDGRSGNLSSANEKYKFTGKERDSETGYDYFGARYYESRFGRWTSIDPLADKYPGLSPYNYCLNNPILLIDPNGEDIFIYGSDSTTVIARIINGDEDQSLYADINWEHDLMEFNITSQWQAIKDYDAWGVSFEASFSLGGGAHGGGEFVNFTSGENAGEWHFYLNSGANIGLEGGIGGSLFGAHRVDGGEVSAESWAGNFNGYSLSVPGLSLGYFWANDKSPSIHPDRSVELYPTMNGRMTWSGESIGTFYSGKLSWGAKWYMSRYSHMGRIY